MKESLGEPEDSAAITAFMRELAAEPLGSSPPDAAFVWWKGQLARRWDAEHRASAPARLDECICAGLAALAGIGLVAWRWAVSPIAAPVAGAASIAGVLILLTSALFVAGDVIVNRHGSRKGLS
jgi:hypothetical protein